MFRRASRRAPSRSPACACSAPQQTCPRGARVRQPCASSTRAVARLTRANRPSVTHPWNSSAADSFVSVDLPISSDVLALDAAAVEVMSAPSTDTPPFASLNLPTVSSLKDAAEELSSSASANSTRAGRSPFNFARSSRRGSRESRSRRARRKARRRRAGCSHTWRNAKRRARDVKPRPRPAAAMSARAASSSWPYSTPEGQTLSQARQPRQRSMWRVNERDSTPSRPSSTARIKYRRPRGPSFSSPVCTYVGHASRHSPQWTHASSLPSSAPSAPASCVGRLRINQSSEATGRERVRRVELRLHAPHQEGGGVVQAPRVELALHGVRRALDDERAARAPSRLAQPTQRRNRLRVVARHRRLEDAQASIARACVPSRLVAALFPKSPKHRAEPGREDRRAPGEVLTAARGSRGEARPDGAVIVEHFDARDFLVFADKLARARNLIGDRAVSPREPSEHDEPAAPGGE